MGECYWETTLVLHPTSSSISHPQLSTQSKHNISYNEQKDNERKTHPTLTQVPPLGPFSTKSVLAPYHPAALLAVPLPPLPPPITIKSYFCTSVLSGIGAIFCCRFLELALEVGSLHDGSCKGTMCEIWGVKSARRGGVGGILYVGTQKHKPKKNSAGIISFKEKAIPNSRPCSITIPILIGQRNEKGGRDMHSKRPACAGRLAGY